MTGCLGPVLGLVTEMPSVRGLEEIGGEWYHGESRGWGPRPLSSLLLWERSRGLERTGMPVFYPVLVDWRGAIPLLAPLLSQCRTLGFSPSSQWTGAGMPTVSKFYCQLKISD